MLQAEIRPGAYYDSVVLMQLQRALAALPGVETAGVVMGTTANKEVLAQSDLLPPDAENAQADDLVIVVRAASDEAARSALAQVDALLTRRTSSADGDSGYRPKSLQSAAKMLPDARWVLISVPGRYAAEVAREGLRLGKHVFLYSDNVSPEDEVALKREAAGRGLLLMGPDCGTAIINGVGLGFANAVRRGPIGVVGASGTGVQAITSRIHALGSGLTHALGTGGRDLSDAVGAITARQSLGLLARDPETEVIVLVSKPPSPAVAQSLLHAASTVEKPVVVNFLGLHPPQNLPDNLHFTQTLDEAASAAVELTMGESAEPQEKDPLRLRQAQPPLDKPGYLRALYSGGTLVYEALLLLQDYLPAVYSNVPLDPAHQLDRATVSREHTVVDLGEDEFTVGRLHPMIDNELRLQRLQQEAADPETAAILLDVVLGYGAHADPASELAPAIKQALATARAMDRPLAVVVVVVGTDADPQNFEQQVEKLAVEGAAVFSSNAAAVRYIGQTLVDEASGSPRECTASQWSTDAVEPFAALPPVDLSVLHEPLVAINVGLASFTESLTAQGASVAEVDWRPPAGGNERLAGILSRMRG